MDSSLRRADALVDAGRLSSGLAYPAVVVVTIGLGVWVIAPALYPVPGKADWWTVESDLYLAGSSFVWHALGMTVYVQQRFSRAPRPGCWPCRPRPPNANASWPPPSC